MSGTENEATITRRLPDGRLSVTTVGSDGTVQVSVDGNIVVYVDPTHLGIDALPGREGKLSVHLYPETKDEPVSLSIASDVVELYADDGDCLRDVKVKSH